MPGSKSNLRYNVRMRRWLSIAALGLILVALPVWAQRHSGGGGGSHFASRGGSAIHSSSSGAFHGGSFGRSSGIRLTIGSPYYTRGFYRRRGYYPYYYPYAGYYPYGWYDGSLDYDSGDQDQYSYAGYQAPANPAPYPENGGLQRDVQALNGKIDRLQADVEARNRPKQIRNLRRHWYSATSMSKKCTITRSPVKPSGF